jgi:hypothetical protein
MYRSFIAAAFASADRTMSAVPVRTPAPRIADNHRHNCIFALIALKAIDGCINRT